MIPVPAKLLASARAALAAALFAYPAFLVVLPRVPGAALALLLIGSLVMLPIAFERRAELARTEDRGPVIGLLLFLVIGAAGAVAWHAPTRVVVNYFRLFPALALIGAIRLLRPPEWVFYAGCAIGALGAGGIALWQFLWQGAARASGPAFYFGPGEATIFGGLSVVLGFLPILANPPNWRPLGKMLLVAGLIGGITAGLLSGSRGPWLAGTALAVWWVGRRRLWAASLLLAAIVGASIMLPIASERWNRAFIDLLSYERGQSETSLGLRFQMWKAAVDAFVANPLFGVGPTGFNAVLAARVQAGLGPPSLVGFFHAHNEVMHALATGGLIYLVGLIGAFWLPWRYFRRVVATKASPAVRAGMALIVAFVVLGLSDSLFVHRTTLTVYVVGTAILVGFAGIPRDPVPERGGRLGFKNVA